jgi:glyoxylase I family protein
MAREIQQNTTIKGCGFHHVAVRTPDWDGSLRFWIEGLGFHLALQWGAAPQRACLLDTGDGNYLELFEREPLANVDAEAPIMHFALRTDDCDAAVERARAAGAEVTWSRKCPSRFWSKASRRALRLSKGRAEKSASFSSAMLFKAAAVRASDAGGQHSCGPETDLNNLRRKYHGRLLCQVQGKA